MRNTSIALFLFFILTNISYAQLRKGQIDLSRILVPQGHCQWPTGDSYLVYPGGNSCIRFEKLREGIVDFEKILILRELTSKSTSKNVKNLMAAFEAHLATFTVARDYSKRDYSVSTLTEAVRNGNRLIRELSNELGR